MQSGLFWENQGSRILSFSICYRCSAPSLSPLWTRAAHSQSPVGRLLAAASPFPTPHSLALCPQIRKEGLGFLQIRKLPQSNSPSPFSTLFPPPWFGLARPPRGEGGGRGGCWSLSPYCFSARGFPSLEKHIFHPPIQLGP